MDKRDATAISIPSEPEADRPCEGARVNLARALSPESRSCRHDDAEGLPAPVTPAQVAASISPAEVHLRAGERGTVDLTLTNRTQTTLRMFFSLTCDGSSPLAVKLRDATGRRVDLLPFNGSVLSAVCERQAVIALLPGGTAYAPLDVSTITRSEVEGPHNQIVTEPAGALQRGHYRIDVVGPRARGPRDASIHAFATLIVE